MCSKLDDMIKKENEPVKEIEYMICPKCRERNSVEAKFCIKCGYCFDESSTDFTDEEKQELNEKVKKRIRWRRKERKIINDMEFDAIKNTQNVVVILAVVGLFGLFYLYYNQVSDIVIPVVMMVGMVLFLPLGMILGWMMLDPYVRCKILRKTTKRNWGVVNFVGRGNKLISRLKNFDDSLIWIGDKVWILTRGFIYQQTKNSNNIVTNKKVIDPESVVTLIDTIPCIFIDIDSMTPLRLSTDDREPVNPMELSSVLKAWMDNERKKLLETKKKMDLVILITCIGAVAGAIIAIMVLLRMEDMQTQLTALKSMINTLQSPP